MSTTLFAHFLIFLLAIFIQLSPSLAYGTFIKKKEKRKEKNIFLSYGESNSFDLNMKVRTYATIIH